MRHAIFIEVETLILIVVLSVMLIKFIKDKILPKWALGIYSAIFLIVIVGDVLTLSNFIYDLNHDAYITYYGGYNQIVKGYDDPYYTTVLLDGKKIRLLCHYTMATNGEHTGYVVYSERSKYVVYVGEKLPESIPKPLPQIPQEE